MRNTAWSPLRDEDGFDGEYVAAYLAEASTLDRQLVCPDCSRPCRTEGGLTFCTGKCGWSTGDPAEATKKNRDPWNRVLPETISLPGDEPKVEILAHGHFETKTGAVIGGVLPKITSPDHSKN